MLPVKLYQVKPLQFGINRQPHKVKHLTRSGEVLFLYPFLQIGWGASLIGAAAGDATTYKSVAVERSKP